MREGELERNGRRRKKGVKGRGERETNRPSERERERERERSAEGPLTGNGCVPHYRRLFMP